MKKEDLFQASSNPHSFRLVLPLLSCIYQGHLSSLLWMNLPYQLVLFFNCTQLKNHLNTLIFNHISSFFSHIFKLDSFITPIQSSCIGNIDSRQFKPKQVVIIRSLASNHTKMLSNLRSKVFSKFLHIKSFSKLADFAIFVDFALH